MVLGRHYKQRWHLFRTMATQLVQHERIYTTQAKALMLRGYAERIIKHAKRSTQGINAGTNEVNRVLTTDLARKKATLELAARFKDQRCNFTRVSKVKYRRRGDNAPVVIIEYRGNEYEKYERQKHDELLKNPKHGDVVQLATYAETLEV